FDDPFAFIDEDDAVSDLEIGGGPALSPKKEESTKRADQAVEQFTKPEPEPEPEPKPEPEPEPEPDLKESQAITNCPICGTEAPVGSSSCAVCGYSFIS
ncbi:MAG: hypothetical protein CMA71_06060, partial [Euryarchaeota archaeon]|nr:hypothetical protein [Euryarchaeota archaeon]